MMLPVVFAFERTELKGVNVKKWCFDEVQRKI
jgi:hypothetical protein